jgi:hypothetical protein
MRTRRAAATSKFSPPAFRRPLLPASCGFLLSIAIFVAACGGGAVAVRPTLLAHGDTATSRIAALQRLAPARHRALPRPLDVARPHNGK